MSGNFPKWFCAIWYIYLSIWLCSCNLCRLTGNPLRAQCISSRVTAHKGSEIRKVKQWPPICSEIGAKFYVPKLDAFVQRHFLHVISSFHCKLRVCRYAHFQIGFGWRLLFDSHLNFPVQTMYSQFVIDPFHKLVGLASLQCSLPY